MEIIPKIVNSGSFKIEPIEKGIKDSIYYSDFLNSKHMRNMRNVSWAFCKRSQNVGIT